MVSESAFNVFGGIYKSSGASGQVLGTENQNEMRVCVLDVRSEWEWQLLLCQPICLHL